MTAHDLTHYDCQLDHIDGWQSWCHEQTHPYHSLVIHQVKNVFRDLEETHELDTTEEANPDVLP